MQKISLSSITPNDRKISKLVDPLLRCINYMIFSFPKMLIHAKHLITSAVCEYLKNYRYHKMCNHFKNNKKKQTELVNKHDLGSTGNKYYKQNDK